MSPRERFQLDEAVEASKERFQALFDTNMLGIAITDLDERILEANDAFLKIVGYTQDDVRTGRISWSGLTPEKYDTVDQKKLRDLLRNRTIEPFEKEYIHKRGHSVPVLVGAAFIRSRPKMGVSFALDITHQKKLEQKKDEFIGTVSHELRTPLAILKTHLALMREEMRVHLSRQRIESSVNELDAQVDHLNLLITDLLNLARLTDDAEVQSAWRVFDVRRCVEKVVDDVCRLQVRKITFKKPRSSCLVRGSEMRIAQVCINILTNALRYSPEHTPVAVAIEKRRDRVRIICKDRGRGIRKADQRRIFERYYRAPSKEQPAGSTGIGLHVCKEIVKQHQGRISVESALGKGATFIVELPLVGGA